jgi:predicted nucleotidyltransferase
MDKNQAIKIIRKFAKAVKKEGISVDRLILYGSYARGKGRTDSDIDVAVISRNFGQDRVEEGMKLFRIAGGIDSRLEPVPISVQAFENDTWIPLIYEIREKGVTLKNI